ncbi:hypothetical protein ACFFX0_19780 [Citricoccus parietis]|uniref:Uncharacterized protein n=1 Tax=Citricoccus parietis TaxID=592307 RepID=A0ABV5G308_9MICC
MRTAQSSYVSSPAALMTATFPADLMRRRWIQSPIPRLIMRSYSSRRYGVQLLCGGPHSPSLCAFSLSNSTIVDNM